MKNQQQFAAISLPTKHGVFTALLSEKGIVALKFPCDAGADVERLHPLAPQQKKMAGELHAQLQQYLRGARTRFAIIPDLRSGTKFQRQIWQEIARIPYGEVRTYQEIARRVGCPAAARAVGQACGSNPVPILIPCHRVVASDGSLGGFSAGLNWKKKLLTLEKR